MDLIAVFPKLREQFEEAIRNLKLESITDKWHKVHKKRLLSASILLEKHQDLEEVDRQKLIDLTLTEGVQKAGQVVASSTTNAQPKSQTLWTSVTDWITMQDSSPGKGFIEEVHQTVKAITDADYLSGLDEMVAREPLLQNAAARAISFASNYFDALIKKQLQKLIHQARFIQQTECKKQIERSATSREEEEMKTLRLELIGKIEEKSQLETTS